jgi:hypothetical protein
MVRAESACNTTQEHAGVLTIPVGGLLASVVGESSCERTDMSKCVEKTEVSSQIDVCLRPASFRTKFSHTDICRNSMTTE